MTMSSMLNCKCSQTFDLDDGEDYRKDCSIKKKAKAHMGDTTRDENDTTIDDSDGNSEEEED